jgi:hypothetical protein
VDRRGEHRNNPHPEKQGLQNMGFKTLVATYFDITEYRIRFSRPLWPHEATLLRGYFGSAFADEVLLHHHHADGCLHYDYPRVQSKVLNKTAHLIGLGEGCAVVMRLWAEVDQARIGTEELPVLESGLTRRRELLGETDEPVTYRFRTPWLGLNQDNHRRYESLGDVGERKALLERVLVGNCLSLAKSLGHRVRAHLSADASGLQPVRARLKGVPMLAFRGTFRINFLLPARLGIGKSVSRGFGTVEPLANPRGGRAAC